MFLFFIRHFNDIDHITPIVWKMNQDNLPITVYCMNPAYNIQSDYRLNFLREKGVKVDYIYNDYDQKLGLLHKFIRFLFLKLYAIERSLSSHGRAQSNLVGIQLKKFAKEYGYRLYKSARKRFCDIHWAKFFLEQTGAKALCFDWIRPKKFVVGPLLRAGQEASIPVISLPHGVFLYTNNYIKFGATEKMRFEKFNPFDYVVLQNPLRKEVIARSGGG